MKRVKTQARPDFYAYFILGKNQNLFVIQEALVNFSNLKKKKTFNF